MTDFNDSPDEGISLSSPVIMDLIEAVHEKGAAFRFRARGHSMAPAIRDGDMITVSPLGSSMPRRGDVLAFRQIGQPRMLVHRVLRTRERTHFVKGDNCPRGDGWIPAETVLGVITKVERRGKARFWPTRSSSSPWQSVYLILYPLWPPVRRLLSRAYRLIRR
jgi:signal peptidase I